MNEVIAALAGAIAVGLIQLVIGRVDRLKRHESMLVAIASEVDALCRLIRHQHYLDSVLEICRSIREENYEISVVYIDIRSNYFSVFESLSSQLGELKPFQVSKVVKFYSYCKSAIDCTRPDGPLAGDSRLEDRITNMFSLAQILETILALGDEIVQFPKISLDGP